MNLNLEMPKYLLSKKHLTLSVVLILGFSILYILIYQPFSSTIWLGFKTAETTLYTFVFYFLCILVMAVSKWLMYKYQLKNNLSIFKFILWVLAEFATIALMYLALTSATFMNHEAVDPAVIAKTLLCVALILVIPYGYMTLFVAYQALQEEYDILKLSISAKNDTHSIQLYDYKGDPAISIPADSIYYMEAQDNYVQIHYLSEGEFCKYLLRCPTQKLEKTIEGTSLVRCHRSYIVNLIHVKCLERGHNRASITLDGHIDKKIPVSASYYKKTLEKLDLMRT